MLLWPAGRWARPSPSLQLSVTLAWPHGYNPVSGLKQNKKRNITDTILIFRFLWVSFSKFLASGLWNLLFLTSNSDSTQKILPIATSKCQNTEVQGRKSRNDLFICVFVYPIRELSNFRVLMGGFRKGVLRFLTWSSGSLPSIFRTHFPLRILFSF